MITEIKYVSMIVTLESEDETRQICKLCNMSCKFNTKGAELNYLNFSPIWNCVSLPRSTTSSGWKILIGLLVQYESVYMPILQILFTAYFCIQMSFFERKAKRQKTGLWYVVVPTCGYQLIALENKFSVATVFIRHNLTYIYVRCCRINIMSLYP